MKQQKEKHVLVQLAIGLLVVAALGIALLWGLLRLFEPTYHVPGSDPPHFTHDGL